jgi:prepilin peptidase CpaA
MYTDFRTGKIRNKLIYPMAALGIICNLFSTQPGIYQSMAGLIGALCFYGFLWKSGALGAGDVKLLAALGALKGISFLAFASFYILGVACLLAIFLLAIKGRLFTVAKWVGQTFIALVIPFIPHPSRLNEAISMPLAPAIFIGTLCALCLEAVHGPFSLFS